MFNHYAKLQEGKLGFESFPYTWRSATGQCLWGSKPTNDIISINPSTNCAQQIHNCAHQIHVFNFEPENVTGIPQIIGQEIGHILSIQQTYLVFNQTHSTIKVVVSPANYVIYIIYIHTPACAKQGYRQHSDGNKKTQILLLKPSQ